jgi:hypothetical protein
MINKEQNNNSKTTEELNAEKTIREVMDEWRTIKEAFAGTNLAASEIMDRRLQVIRFVMKRAGLDCEK